MRSPFEEALEDAKKREAELRVYLDNAKRELHDKSREASSLRGDVRELERKLHRAVHQRDVAMDAARRWQLSLGRIRTAWELHRDAQCSHPPPDIWAQCLLSIEEVLRAEWPGEETQNGEKEP